MPVRYRPGVAQYHPGVRPPSRSLWFAIAAVTTATVLQAQVAWQLLNPASSPTARVGHASALDPGLLRIVVFGGSRLEAGAPMWLDDTWWFDGFAWTQAQPATRPPARAGHGMVLDLWRGRIVLFGGSDRPSGALLPIAHDDTWEWNGTDWLQQTPAHRPPGRSGVGMAFDAARARTVMFGGGFLFLRFDDTWVWDGVDWTNLATAAAPSPRNGVGMADDLARGRIVLFGGYSGALENDTWELDGQVWTQRQPATIPPVRYSMAFTYDIGRQRIVMSGGGTGLLTGELADTWEWDGSDWRQRLPTGTAFAARRGMTLTYDLAQGRSVMFGGSVGNSSNILLNNDTLTYAATTPASFAAYGAGCGGTAGVPALQPVAGRAPWIGDAWGLQLAMLPANAPALLVMGFSRTAWGSTPLPMSLAAFGMPGCSLHSSPEATAFTVAAGQVATWPIAIPNNQALVGMTLFAQAAGMDAAANVGGVVVGNALELTFGGR